MLCATKWPRCIYSRCVLYSHSTCLRGLTPGIDASGGVRPVLVQGDAFGLMLVSCLKEVLSTLVAKSLSVAPTGSLSPLAARTMFLHRLPCYYIDANQ